MTLIKELMDVFKQGIHDLEISGLLTTEGII